MKKVLIFAAFLILALGSAAFAAELGVMPDTETVDGKVPALVFTSS